MGCNLMIDVLKKVGNLDKDRKRMEAETEVMHLQAKMPKSLLVTARY